MVSRRQDWMFFGYVSQCVVVDIEKLQFRVALREVANMFPVNGLVLSKEPD